MKIISYKNKNRMKLFLRRFKKVPKIIFLDIDGVLNSEVDFKNYTDEEKERYHDIAMRPLKLLDDLVTETKALIVVSSTWRSRSHTWLLREVLDKPITDVDRLQMIFKQRGFKNWKSIIAVTPVLKSEGMVRGNEIYYWIKHNEKILNCNHNDFSSYVIFDDDSDMLLWQQKHFFKTDGYVGLTRNLCYKAKYFLNGYKYK